MRGVLSSNVSVIRKVLSVQAEHHTPEEIDGLLGSQANGSWLSQGLFSLPHGNERDTDQRCDLDSGDVVIGGQHCLFSRGGG